VNVDKKEVEVLKRARESFFVRRDRVLTGREAPELPVERAFRCRKPEHVGCQHWLQLVCERSSID
jgi:hypothetical protein